MKMSAGAAMDNLSTFDIPVMVESYIDKIRENIEYNLLSMVLVDMDCRGLYFFLNAYRVYYG